MDYLPSFLLFIAGCAFTLLVSRAYAQRKVVSYWSSRKKILSRDGLKNVDGLSLSFYDSEIFGLIRHELYVWNSGNVPVWADEIRSGEAVKFIFGERALISIEQMTPSDKDLKISVSVEGEAISAAFESLDRGQGFKVAALEILADHTQSPSDPSFQAPIVGLSRPPQRRFLGRLEEGDDEWKAGLGCIALIGLPGLIALLLLDPGSLAHSFVEVIVYVGIGFYILVSVVPGLAISFSRRLNFVPQNFAKHRSRILSPPQMIFRAFKRK